MKGLIPQGERDLEKGHGEGTLGSNVEDANRTKGSSGDHPGDNEERPEQGKWLWQQKVGGIQNILDRRISLGK